jgi:hypothetical protein
MSSRCNMTRRRIALMARDQGRLGLGNLRLVPLVSSVGIARTPFRERAAGDEQSTPAMPLGARFASCRRHVRVDARTLPRVAARFPH